jgi:hypothetical protein
MIKGDSKESVSAIQCLRICSSGVVCFLGTDLRVRYDRAVAVDSFLAIFSRCFGSSGSHLFGKLSVRQHAMPSDNIFNIHCF